MTGDHPFAKYLRVVGRGPSLSRDLEEHEAAEAMAMVLAGKVTPEQLGAFLLVLRYKGESGAELAGFVRAARASFAAPQIAVDLDWPSYADRHRQQPWFVLSALLLAENGCRVLMHGIAGHSEGYAPTRPALAALGVAPCLSLAEAAARLEAEGFAYLGLERICPALERLFALRPSLGVRTVVNSLSRALNPMAAPCQLQGVFHPPYRATQQEAALRLGQPHAAIFKGGAGEVQRTPLKPCLVATVHAGEGGEEEWPATLAGADYRWRDEALDPGHLAALWRGEREDPVPAAAVAATAAVALKLAGRAATKPEAEAMATEMWRARPREKYGGK